MTSQLGAARPNFPTNTSPTGRHSVRTGRKANGISPQSPSPTTKPTEEQITFRFSSLPTASPRSMAPQMGAARPTSPTDTSPAGQQSVRTGRKSNRISPRSPSPTTKPVEERTTFRADVPVSERPSPPTKPTEKQTTFRVGAPMSRPKARAAGLLESSLPPTSLHCPSQPAPPEASQPVANGVSGRTGIPRISILAS